MSNEIYNPLLAIEDGLIYPFVGQARAKEYPEAKITEAAIIGIENNIKTYKKLINKAEQIVGEYHQKGTKINETEQLDKISEYKSWLNEAERALEILNEGYGVVYKTEIIKPL